MIIRKTDGTPYCSLNVEDDLFIIGMLEGSAMPGYTVALDKKILGPLKKFLDTLENHLIKDKYEK